MAHPGPESLSTNPRPWLTPLHLRKRAFSTHCEDRCRVCLFVRSPGARPLGRGCVLVCCFSLAFSLLPFATKVPLTSHNLIHTTCHLFSSGDPQTAAALASHTTLPPEVSPLQRPDRSISKRVEKSASVSMNPLLKCPPLEIPWGAGRVALFC